MKSNPITPGLFGYFTGPQLEAYLIASRGQRRGTVSSKWLPHWQVFEVREHSPAR